ncbi:MAG: MOSC domain-containing protein [Bacteroidota bacterium]|nr:MOSC domain-containing protein [Bacteroidota bacterium]
MSTLSLTEIRIYPIKSLGGIALNKAQVRKKGLQHDRRWMLIDERGVAMTQREYHEMALFKPRIEGQQINIEYTRDGRVVSSAGYDISRPPSGEKITAQVWADQVSVLEVDSTLSQWFSDYLRVNCRLVAFPEKNPRAVDPRYAIANDHVSLADAYPFLIIGQASLDDLNSKLDTPVPMNRFRPNFVFAGGTAFAEDSWRELTIGQVQFVAVKKSARCILPTVNQDTASKGPEPLRTLSKYRKVGNNVYFGQNMIAHDEGMVAVGDAIIPG